MAFCLRYVFRCQSSNITKNLLYCKKIPIEQNVLFNTRGSSSSRRTYSTAFYVIGGLGISGGLYGYLAAPDRQERAIVNLAEKTESSIISDIPDIKPSREVSGVADIGLELILFQYQTCPFCCKVRSFLDFYGIPYKVIEVNPVMRQQLKFSKYKKVPILIVKDKKTSTNYQLNDSSVIISILGTFLIQNKESLENILKMYVTHVYTDEKGKEIQEVLNAYFLMFGDKASKGRKDELIEKERHWRKWADKEFVHLLSPNIYRTYNEALQAFNYFSEVGEWEKNFSTLERLSVIYIGATAMYIIGKRLKKRYLLKENVRESLYDACNQWLRAVGHKNKFMGGDVPNLADLAVFGMLSSIEGCLAFEDLLNNTTIGTWYYNMKETVTNHSGHQLL